MASSRSSTSSASSRRPSSYDVFINFRGSDTRENFVSLLYDALRRDGIHAFIDSEELWEGEEIRPSLLRAIRGSKISIPVFSEHYADSKYCLLELAEISERHLFHGQIVLPIFIDIEPRDVKHQTGSFQGPFEEHQRKCESATVDRWKNALAHMGNLKGWPLKGDAKIKEQSKIVESVVQSALRELNSTPLDECIHLVGIDSHVDKVLSLLHMDSDDVRFLGICGMGGIGKTAIAKAVYNRIFRNFNGSSFLADIREESSRGNKGLVSLQKRLLQDIFKRDYDMSIVSRGLIKERLHGKRILVILDDVDDHEQLDALAGGLNWFGRGSKVIITTRDVHILNVHKSKVDQDIQIYMPKVLDFKNSLKVFSLHAFSKNEPPEDYKNLSHEVVHRAEGLPLTLEVLGSFLLDKNKEEWEDALERLKDILDDKVFGKSIESYDDKVFRKLMISYNKLGDPEKTIFLDVACHFRGWEKTEPIAIWEACELRPKLALKELIQKHLVKIDAFDRLRMHDQLQYMGRSIVLKESYRDPTKRSRLWSHDEIMKVLKKDMQTQMVEGILVDQNFEFEAEDGLCYEDFMKMPNLRFLQVDGIDNLDGDFSHLPSRLRWFCWEQCPLKILPPNFYHEELIHFQLSESCIKQAWNNAPQNKNKRFQKLKVLILSDCKELSVSPDFFSWFPCLQRLDLRCCKDLRYLVKLPSKLIHLNCDFCTSLVRLPDLSNLKGLRELHITNCENLEEIHGLEGTESLEKLIAPGCYKLTDLPDLSYLKSLRELDITNCENLEEIHGLNGTESLELLKARDCHKLTKSLNLSKLTRLRKLDISYCENLEEIHGLEGTESLKELDARGCYKLTETVRRIHGQGRLLDIVGAGSQGSNSIADDEIYHGPPILCVVFAFKPRILKLVKSSARVTVNFEIEAFIRWGVQKTFCNHSIRIEDIELTPREIVYIHHFNGFPFESKDAIEILRVVGDSLYCNVEVKLWKLLFENKELDQQMPYQQSSAMLVADFFRWSDVEDDEDDVEEAYFFRWAADVEEVEGNKSFESVSELVGAEEEMLRPPSKRSRLHDNNDEASGSSLSMTLTPCEVKLFNSFNLQQIPILQPNIDDEFQGFPFNIEEAERSNRTINFFGSSYDGVRRSNNVPEEVEEEEDDTTAGSEVCDFFVG